MITLVIPGEDYGNAVIRGKGTQVERPGLVYPPGFPSPHAALRRSAGNDNGVW
jgi:hypothetical protein